MNQKEFQAVLDWMLSHTIIQYHEYNYMLQKSLPFLRR
ncbi:hypothetical protein Goe6_c00210 [Bacillus phage vB_BveP-Goe6]|uniref:Uncharacterized protein n=1 Tax=Bacillus phage vB_BveP-Goe6 TaxID=2022474 RepID=A0A222YZA0_9CAUD|nr:hypothetical protein H3014_gp06 [Bacillus phage vB_BveP-Goe6]ASR76806.1 hypothetical protein Goe6_c00210 [Bacillus phage vB_BveP-Goe6]